MRFTGTNPAKLDAKGRVFFPSAYRRQLPAADTELVLKRDIYQPCLVIYPQAVWEREVDELSCRLNRWNPREAMVFRRFLADAETFVLDAAGRFLVPRHLLEAAALSHDVLFVGVDDRVELWDKAHAAAAFMPQDAFAAELERLMAAPQPPAGE